jgi:tRNA (cytidine/uridine-2'-O-)-methyltransferase
MFHVVLISPEIPPNTGNIGRLCLAAHAHLHLIEPLGFKLDDRTLKRAGMDYWQHLRWHLWPSFEAFQTSLAPHARLFFVENHVDHPAPSLWTVTFQKADYLLFGRESFGIPQSLLKSGLGTIIQIPMFHPQSRSLNLSNAVAITLYEALRQIHQKMPD